MNKITEVTRREIIDQLIAPGHNWSGSLGEDEFLSRLFDLESLPSTDYRHVTAAGDIRQHRMGFHDWPDDWVFYDKRFDILRGSDEQFIRFLCETVHPVVRPNTEEALSLVELYKKHLAKDGWEIFEKSRMSDRPVFAGAQRERRIEIFEEPTGWPKVDRQLGEVRLRLREATNEEQFQAIGLLCRETLISLAEIVYDANEHPTLDGTPASRTDAGRMLEAYLAAELKGPANEEARAHAKASLKLALALQHKRTAEFRTAALCAEATTSVVNIVAILSGRRER